MQSNASLLFSCADQVGIIAELANFFSQHGLNISRYEEYTDEGQFFSRLEWRLTNRWSDQSEFMQEFEPIARAHNANYQAHFFDKPQRIGLFASKQTHALIEILNKQEAGFFPTTEISFILSNYDETQIVADRHGIPFFYLPTSGSTHEYEAKQLAIVQQYQPDYLALARYMKVLSGDFIDQAACPIINIHHSFLPSFVGAKPYQMAYDRGVKLIGATSHFVTPVLDQGPIIEQDVQRVTTGASVQDMIKMGRDIEQKVFARALLKALEHKIIVYKNRTMVFN